MPTRQDVVDKALEFDGYANGHGYDCSNRFSEDLGKTKEAWCDDYISDIFRLAGVPMPSMEPGYHTGAGYVPDTWAYGDRHHALRHSWDAQPADPIVFCWPGGNPEGDHIELTVWWKNGVLRTIGGNSSPSNVNGYKGVGGVHLHDWDVPEGRGLSVIKNSIDASKIVDFTRSTTIPAKPKHTGPRPLELKSPHLHGKDVEALQKKLAKNGHPNLDADGVFGPATRKALIAYQHTISDNFGVCAVHTRKSLRLK